MIGPYRALVRALRRVPPGLAPRGSKMRRALEGRATAPAALTGWAADGRDPSRPLVWLHAPSVGEGVRAGAVLEALRALRPDVQTVFTHFSPSAEGFARGLDVDVAAYLPWDVPEVVDPVVAALRPTVVAFTHTEVWPTLVERAAAAGARTALVAGVLPPGAGRARRPARSLLRPTWGALSLACAVSTRDADGLRGLGVRDVAVAVTGDPAIDAAVSRVARADPAAPHLAALRGRTPTVVAGSTWPSDERVLLPALAAVRARVGGTRVVVAPHEPGADRVRSLSRALERDGWRVTTLSALEAGGRARTGEVEPGASPTPRADEGRAPGASFDAVVVDSVGVLAELYSAADVAYVGGGFRRAGQHSVVEPAAAGCPVLIGPRHAARDPQAALVAAGGAKIASRQADATSCLALWLTDRSVRHAAAHAARAWVEERRGAARRTAELLEALM